MKKQIAGDRAAIAPILLDGLRDHVASTFAQRIAGVLPEVIEFIDFESELVPDPRLRKALAAAARALFPRQATIRERLAAEVASAFDAKIDPMAAGARRMRIPLESLTLLDDDQMEEEVVLIAGAQRLKEQSEYQLFALTRCIGLLTGQDHISDHANPVFPRVFTEALMKALGTEQGDASVKVAMFKAFGPVILEILPEIYRAGTDWLKERGVELDVYVYRPIVSPPRQCSSPEALETAHVMSGEISAALAEVKVVPAIVVQPGQAATLRDSLVGSMFRILDEDARISPPMREQIRRLHRPIATMVQKDPVFLTKPAHPARQLLDLLAGVDSVLEVNDNACLIDAIDQIVSDVVRMHEHDPLAFALTYERLDALLDQQELASMEHDTTIQALRDAEKRACAHEAVNAAISTCFAGQQISPDVAAFTSVIWRDVLVTDYLNGGADGPNWKLGVATMRALVASVQPVVDVRSRSERSKSLGSLIELLRDGIEHAGLNPVLAEQFMQALQKLHWNALFGNSSQHYKAASVVMTAELAPVASSLSDLNLARGSVLQLRDAAGPQRWRICWEAQYSGQCALRRSNGSELKLLTLQAIRSGLASGELVAVDPYSPASEAIGSAFREIRHLLTPQANGTVATQGTATCAPPDASKISRIAA